MTQTTSWCEFCGDKEFYFQCNIQNRDPNTLNRWLCPECAQIKDDDGITTTRILAVIKKNYKDGDYFNINDFVEICMTTYPNMKPNKNVVETYSTRYDIKAAWRTAVHEHSPSSCQYWRKGGKLYKNKYRALFINEKLSERNNIKNWEHFSSGGGPRGKEWRIVLNLSNIMPTNLNEINENNNYINQYHIRLPTTEQLKKAENYIQKFGFKKECLCIYN